jgi:hypothetical protein
MIKVINCGILLNANFSHFKGQLINKNSFLSWSTQGEQNMHKFEIEKSNDGMTFNMFASVIARNTPEAWYNFTDPELITNKTYYRIKMIDNDGLFKYSNVVLLSPDLRFEVRPLKNPFMNTISAEVIIPDDGKLNLNLFNDKGQLIKTTQMDAKKGINITTMENITALDGMYFLSVSYKNETIKTKLVKLN